MLYRAEFVVTGEERRSVPDETLYRMPPRTACCASG
jgi:hypothetical protein